jgi:hypothetical protein
MSAVEDGAEFVASKLNTEQSFIRAAYTLAAYQAILDWAMPDLCGSTRPAACSLTR